MSLSLLHSVEQYFTLNVDPFVKPIRNCALHILKSCPNLILLMGDVI